MDIKTAFRVGFLKKATSLNLSEDEAKALYEEGISKLAFYDQPATSNDVAEFKHLMSSQGYNPPISGDPMEANLYNAHMLGQRDYLARQNADVATAKGAVGAAIPGGAVGGAAGYLAGQGVKRLVNPAKFSRSALAKLPRRFGMAGLLGGALASAVPGALNARHNVQLAQKLEDPRNLEHTVRQIGLERNLVNNQY